MKFLFLLLLFFGCLNVQAAGIDPVYKQMTGTYMSPGDKNLGTKLSLDGAQFEYEFYTDVHASTEIRETKKLGQYLIADNVVYIPFVNLYRHKQGGKAKYVTSASINAWHIDKINNTPVLIRDDEYAAWRASHIMPSALGILIKVSAKPYQFNLEWPSLKALGAFSQPGKEEAVKPAAKPSQKDPVKQDVKVPAKSSAKAPAKPAAKADKKPSKKAPVKSGK